jgi:carbonic anhydrase
MFRKSSFLQNCLTSATRLPTFKNEKVPKPCNFNFNDNGKNWGNDFPMCKDGCKQSPIDLPGPNPIESTSLSIKMKNYKNIAYPGIVQKSYGWLGVDVKAGEMEIKLPGGYEDTYVPLNFHFHSPADHTILGKTYDLEMHIVHV